jgi:hypothetical protein
MNLNIGDIVKQHRYETVCAVLALVILLALWPARRLGSQAEAKTEEVQALNARLKKSLNGLGQGPANPSLIQSRKDQALALANEAEEIAGLLKQKNRRSFLVQDMFTESPDPGAPMRFRDCYRQAIEQLLSETLRAGWPEEGRELAAGKDEGPSDIGVYAQRDVLNIGLWESASDLPDAEDCWFAQLDFWIQQDLAEIFSQLNRNSAQQRGQQPSVLNAAVKRIVSIYVDSYYYVGLDTQSGQAVPGPYPMGVPGGPMNAPGSGPMMEPGMQPPGGGYWQQPGGGYWQPPVTVPTKARHKSARDRLRDRAAMRQEKPFTERLCGDNVNVLHFSFSVVIDSRRVNELLAALSRKNLYTILDVSLSRVDVDIDSRKFPRFESSTELFSPYKDAEDDGLIYGTDPVVKLDVDAEALFLKDIYADYMPKEVRDVLSAKTNEAKEQRLNVQEARKKAKVAAERAKKAKERRASRSRPKSRR